MLFPDNPYLSTYDLSSLLQAIRDGWEPEFVFFWSGKQTNEGDIGPECLSQWYPISFSVGDTSYSTAKHFMMAEKARVFGDRVVLQRILNASSPKRTKQLDRQVRGFDEQTWLQERFGLAVRGSRAKFQQSERLRRYLIDTHKRVLAEASPHDSVWGSDCPPPTFERRIPSSGTGKTSWDSHSCAFEQCLGQMTSGVTS